MSNLKELQKLTKNLSVLYVEDDLAIQKTMVLYLKKFFNIVISANDGLDGLKKYQLQKFDIVITDLSMPKMNGLDMLEQMKEINENQSILITTAHSESTYMFGAIKAQVDGYVIKPFDFKQLNYELFKVSEKLKRFRENEEYKLHLKEMVDDKTSQLSQMMDFQTQNYEKTLFSMVEMIEKRDTYTAGHSKRVAKYCEEIAREMGYTDDKCTMIHQAGILHDVGKIGTPDAVLLNPKKLNKLEYKLIQEHVEVSYKLLNNIPMFKPLSEIVYSHHERYDGGGYPRGLKANEIEPLARIMIVADAFDAMTTNRIYKVRKSVKVALEELVELSSKQFHPEVVQSAIIALRNTVIDKSISQLPQTKLEEERFAYFYKDTLSEAYNQTYLDVILMKNRYDNKFKYMQLFYIHNFSTYNKQYGWKDGDKLLSKISNILCKIFDEALVFRIFGDDFAVISEAKIDLELLKEGLETILQDTNVTYTLKNLDLIKNTITDIRQIEKL